MKATRMRAGVVAVLMTASFAGALVWRPTAHLSDQLGKINLEVIFPKSFGAWREDDRVPVQLISPDTAAMLNRIYNQTLSRTYVNAKGDRIMLSVAYGGDQSDGTRAHRPEVCYPAQGFQVSSQERSTIQLNDTQLPVRRLVARMGGRIEPITYWVTVGDHIALSGPEQKFAQLSYSTRGVIPDGMLVRVSSLDSDQTSAYALHRQFVLDLAAVLPASFKNRIVGGPAV